MPELSFCLSHFNSTTISPQFLSPFLLKLSIDLALPPTIALCCPKLHDLYVCDLLSNSLKMVSSVVYFMVALRQVTLHLHILK